MSLPWRRDSWDPQILQSKFMTGLTNLSRSSVIQTESGFFSRFTDAEVSSGGIESRWDQIFRNCPDRPWCPPSLMWNWHWVSFPGTRRPERSHLRLASRLRKSRAIPLLALWAPVACYRLKHYPYLTFPRWQSTAHTAPDSTLYNCNSLPFPYFVHLATMTQFHT